MKALSDLDVPKPSTSLRVESVRDGAAFAAMRREWGELLESSDAGVFNAWEWLYPWYRRIGADRELLILTARHRSDRLIGVMPLCIEHRRLAGRRVAFLAETHVGSDYLDVVARRGSEQLVARTFAAGLRDLRSSWDVLDLTDFSSESVTLEAFRQAFAGDLHEVGVTDRFICPCQPFKPGETWEAFLAGTARRDNYVRRKKWLQKQPGYRIEVDHSPRAVADFFRLHAMRWSEDGGSQGIVGPSVEAFHRDAMDLLAEQGKLRLYTMRIGSQAVASVYGIVHGGEFLYYQSGYDPEWRTKSVGLVLVGETFKDAIEAGLRGFDFLRGTEAYKSDWVTQERRTVALRIHERRGRGAWLGRSERAGKRVRDAAKAVLPTRLIELIRRVRRRRSAI